MHRLLIGIVLVLFGALTAVALYQHGYWGIVAPHFQSTGAGQVFADLVIALVLVLIWIWKDARALGRNPWPWVFATLALGSFGPLVYLLTRQPSPEVTSSKESRDS
ncbi:DUF2834 domain-containing protein [bacterium]|nr:DUF2834 domain-containing protein [bacterium]